MPQVVRVSKEQLGIDAGYVHVNVIESQGRHISSHRLSYNYFDIL